MAPGVFSPPQRPVQALAIGGALPLPRPGWLSSPTLGRANRFLSTAAVSLMTPRRPLSTSEKVKVRTLSAEQRTREDSRCRWGRAWFPRVLLSSVTPTLGRGRVHSPSWPVLWPGGLSRAWGVRSEAGNRCHGNRSRSCRTLPCPSPMFFLQALLGPRRGSWLPSPAARPVLAPQASETTGEARPLTPPCPSLVEGSHWNEGLLLGRPPEEPEQPLTENSLLEVLDGAVMMYNLSVHQQLGKVLNRGSKCTACGSA